MKVSNIGGTSTGHAISPVLVIVLVVAVVLGIALLTHGVPPVVGLPVALVGAFLIDRAVFGSGR